MSAISASPALPSSASAAWREFGAFLRRPVLLQPTGLRTPNSWTAFCSLAVLHAMVMLLLLPVLAAWQIQGSAGAPTAFSAVPQDLLLPLVVLVAPLLEEVLFRGWLTGRPRAIWLVPAGLLAFLPLVIAPDQPLLSGGLMLGGMGLAVIGWFKQRRLTDAPHWYVRHFGWVFYGMVIVFGLLHVSNYENPGLMAVPMILPQLWCAMMLGFVRLRIGLPSAIVLHALSNGVVIAFATAGQ